MRFILVLLTVLLLASISSAESRANVERQFETWKEQVVWPSARSSNVQRETFVAALGNVRINWALPDLQGATSGSQDQAEFAAPATYFNANTVSSTIRGGQQNMARYRQFLTGLERSTGVPGHIVLAVWGRESAYGRANIPHNVFEVLATRSFIGQRKENAFRELIAALLLAQSRGINPSQMRSSWAGALGQPQFMPSNVARFAVDGDQDGRVDIWNSDYDTMASIATYLAKHGWQRGRDWGFEVNVPANVSCTLEGPDQGRRISQWEALGVRRANGRPFPAHEVQGRGYLMMPAGRLGPAFIVTPNFYALKEYNESDLYALFVGHVGDRIAYGGGSFHTGWQRTDRMSRASIAQIQQALVGMGQDVGGVDGLPGYKTRRSIGRWQEARGQLATCFPAANMR